MNFLKLLKTKLRLKVCPKTRKKIKHIAFSTAKYAFFLFVLSVLFVLVLFIYYSRDLPRPENFTEKPFIQSTKIYDKTGKILLYDIYGEERREIVSLTQISENFKKAILASEDSRFYQHHGVDLIGIARAILIDLKLKSPSQGASTITQQLIRSSFLTMKKTAERKIQEIILALELERKYSKDQILEWYLNQIPFGDNSYGIEAASQTFFKKASSDLSIPESATLAAMVSAPSYYSPYGPNRQKLLLRKDYILNRMAALDYITQEQLKTALSEEIVFADASKAIKAPHFVFYVKSYLTKEYGEDYLREKGLKVYTSLDWDVQKNMEDVVTEKTKSNEGFNANNTAAVTLNPKTGEILGLIGSKNYFGEAYPEGCESNQGKCLFDPYFDVATLGERQPGSSFKPFVYATAFKKGYLPSTILWDVPTEFNPSCNPDGTQEKNSNGMDCYHPHNYDEAFRGKVTIRQSLAQSLNLPSVKLLYLAGIEDSLKTAWDLGLTTLTDKNRYGLSLVLGGGEVNLLEMTSAYGAFATEGLIIPPVSILKIEDADGNIIKENKKEPKRVLSVQVARLINDVLSDNDARVPAFSRENPLYFKNYQVAAKTGTTSNYVDVWTVGYTPFAVVGVWAGNNDSSPINKKSGIGLAAPIWRMIMEKLLTTNPIENFSKPDTIIQNKPVLNGESPERDIHEILYYIDKNNPLGSAPTNPADDSQYVMWEESLKNWLSKNLIPQL
ncbi:PBP1A family penicillin-binding protein [Patescibacteria group bacterium]|nr:PBP1A family penicillin-binding protein [Patescibacteria group bacterium]